MRSTGDLFNTVEATAALPFRSMLTVFAALPDTAYDMAARSSTACMIGDAAPLPGSVRLQVQLPSHAAPPMHSQAAEVFLANNETLGNALEKLSEELYSSDVHFVLELVQVGGGRQLGASGLGGRGCRTGGWVLGARGLGLGRWHGNGRRLCKRLVGRIWTGGGFQWGKVGRSKGVGEAARGHGAVQASQKYIMPIPHIILIYRPRAGPLISLHPFSSLPSPPPPPPFPFPLALLPERR